MNEIRTKDPREAAYLWTLEKRFRLTGTSVSTSYGKKVVWFLFETEQDADSTEKLRGDFRMGNCLVEPNIYATRLGDVKSIIREECYEK